MKAGAMMYIVFGLLLLSLASGITSGQDCSSRSGAGSSVSQHTLSLPTGLKLLSPIIDASVKIVLNEGHSLNLSQHCDCRPPCAIGMFQHTSVQATGASSAFGGTVEWEKQLSNCVPGTGGSSSEVSSVSVEGSYIEGTGRWFGGANASILGISGDTMQTMMAFSFDTKCSCREAACPDQDSHYPDVTATPEELHLIVGITSSIRIDASDDDSDLQVSSISPVAPVSLSVAPTSGGGPGGSTASETFSITCLDDDISESAIRFTVWDDLGNSSDVEVPVIIWRGGPAIEIVEEETGWESGAYVVRFRLDDPDFANCDQRIEVVTWGTSGIQGGSVISMEALPWIATEVCSTQSEEGHDTYAGLYVVAFIPDEAPGTQRFTIWAEDIAGHRTSLPITLNSAPIGKDESLNNIKGSLYAVTIEDNVLENDSDLDGDLLTAELVPGSGPSVGTLDFSSDGSFIYDIDPEHVEMAWFEYTVSDGRGGTDTARVTLEVYAPSGSPPVLSVSSLPSVSCPDALGAGQDCQQFEVEVIDLDLSEFWKWEAVTLVAVSQDGAMCLLSGFGNSVWANQLVIDAPGVTKGALAVRTDRNYATTSIQLLATDLAGLKDTATLRFTGNEPPKVTFDGGLTWYTCGGTTVTSMCMSTGPSMFTMDPAWLEAGCLQFRDLDGDALTFRMTQLPRLGTANLMTTGSGGNYYVTVMYEIDRDAMLACHRDRRGLADQLIVQATDPYGGVSEATMSIRFDVVNSPPVCEDDSTVTPSGVPVTVSVLANDSDPDEDALTIAEVATPAGGGASIVGDDVVYTPNPGVCGIDTFSYVADDGYEGQTTGWVSVEVLDTIAPVAACQPTTLYLDSNGQATLDPASLDGGSTDNCGIARFEASRTTFGCADVGANPVTLTVYDYADNTDTCDTAVTIVDAIDPVARGHDLTLQLDEFGSAAIQASDIDDGSSDNCSGTLSLDKSSFGCADLGVNTVTLTATDPSLHADSVSVLVTVEDPIAPVARCHDITASLNSSGTLTLADHAVDNGSTDNCAIASFSLSPKSFDCGDVGDHAVTMTVIDSSGNSDSCTATVTVVDTTTPTITCPADVSVSADPGQCYATNVNLGSPTATDACGVDWGTLTNNAPNQFPLGDTTVTWTVDDIYGNTASCTQRVTVTETTPPTVNCPSDITETTHDSSTIVTFSASASDNCDPSPSVSYSPSSGTNFPIGRTTVTCTATDVSGNQDTCTFDVIVNFVNQAPTTSEIKIVVPNFNNPIPITLTGYDADGDTLQYFIVDGPGDGYLTGSPPDVTYHRSGGGLDYDYFSFRVYDGFEYSNTSYVVVDP